MGQSPPLLGAKSIKAGLRVQCRLILRTVQAESMEFQVGTKLLLCGSLRCAAGRSILRPATLLPGILHKSHDSLPNNVYGSRWYQVQQRMKSDLLT